MCFRWYANNFRIIVVMLIIVLLRLTEIAGPEAIRARSMKIGIGSMTSEFPVADASSIQVADLGIAEELVLANHILVERGVLDGFGHVSARSLDDSSTFLISRNRAPALVQIEDLQTLDFSCVPGDARPRYLEAFIHAEIYRARPDVMAIVHSHSDAVVPISAVDVPLRPMIHMAGFLHPHAPVFDLRDAVGDGTDLLIRDNHQGAELARTLADRAVVLMRGHGSTAVGRSVAEAVYRAVYTEVAAKALVTATRLGVPVYLSEAEARAADETISAQIERTWDYWKRKVEQAV